jgi:oxaloacetate decarboxylase (Na+ extruding) subunit alpha
VARVELIDTTLRDGNQSLWSATGMTTRMILDVAPDLGRAGFRALDFITSTHMGTAVRFHREDPWERIRLAAEAMPDTPLGFLTSGLRFISWQKLPADVMALAMRLLVDHGIRRVWVIDSMNDVDAALQSARLAKQAGAEEVVVGLVYSLSPVHTPELYERMAAALVRSEHIDALYLKDPGGLLTPETTAATIAAIEPHLGGMALELHSHSNTGMAPLCYLKAAELGVDRLHTACRPLANGASQPSTEQTADNLRELGFDVDIDDEAVGRVSAYFVEVARREGLPIGVPAEYDVAHYRHQVPGGMISTLERQLREAGLSHRLADALHEIPRVRAELGYPIMVTPFSQFVGTQAVMNVVTGERYKRVPDQVIRYVQGEFGAPPAPIDPEVQERVLGRARARKLAQEPRRSLEDWRSELGRDLPGEELLLRIVMAGDQVDAMRAAREQPVTRRPAAARAREA